MSRATQPYIKVTRTSEGIQVSVYESKGSYVKAHPGTIVADDDMALAARLIAEHIDNIRARHGKQGKQANGNS